MPLNTYRFSHVIEQTMILDGRTLPSNEYRKLWIKGEDIVSDLDPREVSETVRATLGRPLTTALKPSKL